MSCEHKKKKKTTKHIFNIINRIQSPPVEGTVSAWDILPTDNQRCEKGTAVLANESIQTHESNQTPIHPHGFTAVSYTHLTLPTIYSV